MRAWCTVGRVLPGAQSTLQSCPQGSRNAFTCPICSAELPTLAVILLSLVQSARQSSPHRQSLHSPIQEVVSIERQTLMASPTPGIPQHKVQRPVAVHLQATATGKETSSQWVGLIAFPAHIFNLCGHVMWAQEFHPQDSEEPLRHGSVRCNHCNQVRGDCCMHYPTHTVPQPATACQGLPGPSQHVNVSQATAAILTSRRATVPQATYLVQHGAQFVQLGPQAHKMAAHGRHLLQAKCEPPHQLH